MKNRKNEKGFTLVELLIVMVIIGILMAIAVPKLAGSDEGAVLSSMISDARNAITAEQLYYSANQQYVDATVSDGSVATLGTSNVKVSASPNNTVSITANNGGCTDGSDGFSVTVTSTKTNKQVTYNSCTDTSPSVN